MSSIYKKGRDGYFYYQAYVKNENTGKKDKKIFHSLGTKDRKIAKSKQLELDKLYMYKKTDQSIAKWRIFLVFSVIIISVLLFFPTQNHSKYNNTNDLKPERSQDISDKLINNVSDLEKPDIKIEGIQDVTVSSDSIHFNDTENLSPIQYLIAREENSSNAFDQIKIFLNVKKGYSKNQLRSVCEDISVKKNNYSNIIICIYDDSQIGILLSSGKEPYIGSSEQKGRWLAMYSYNSVEGVYFDLNPGEYRHYE